MRFYRSVARVQEVAVVTLIVVGVIALILFVYLLVAVIRPEKF